MFGLKESLRKLENKCEEQEIRIKKLEATVRRQQNALDMLSKEIDSLRREINDSNDD